MKTPKPNAVKRPRWRDVSDEVTLALTPKGLDRAPSLCPTPATMWQFVDASEQGHEAAVAIIASWAFRFPVVTA